MYFLLLVFCFFYLCFSRAVRTPCSRSTVKFKLSANVSTNSPHVSKRLPSNRTKSSTSRDEKAWNRFCDCSALRFDFSIYSMSFSSRFEPIQPGAVGVHVAHVRSALIRRVDTLEIVQAFLANGTKRVLHCIRTHRDDSVVYRSRHVQ